MKPESEMKIEAMIEEVGKILHKENQGFVFSTYSEDHNLDLQVMNCISTHDPEKFWLSIIPLVLNMNKVCPEDDREKFRNEFIAFVAMITDECFPSMRINTK